MSEAVAVAGVVKRYQDGARRVEAVAGVTLAVPERVLWVLRGPSGSGKTTLLALMGGMVPPTQGDVRIGGKSVVHLRDRHRTGLRRTAIGFVFQELALISGMSLIENVLLPLAPLGGPTPAQLTRARALLERFGLAAERDARVERLSGGQRQRGALARALIHDPPVLLLDEPTAHLDAANVQAVADLLAGLRDEGRTIVAATHDPRLAGDARVDRVLDLVDGRIQDEARPG